MSLEWSAWTGRAVALFLLAYGWSELVSRLVPGKWSSLWAAWLFLLMQAIGHFSGEWMVGGLEGKVFSFGFTFWALACCIDKKWNFRFFHIAPEKPFWHAVYSETNRFSFGYMIRPKASLPVRIKRFSKGVFNLISA